MGRSGDQEDPQRDTGDAGPAQRRHLLVEHEVIEQQDRDVRERRKRVRERQRRARQDDQPHERGDAEEEEPSPHERLPDEDTQRAAAERERRRSELVVHVVHPRLQRELRHRGERDGQEDHRDEHGGRSFPDVRLRCFRERVRARGAHRTSTSTSTRASTRSCTRGTSTTSNTYRCVCTWYRCPVGRADNPTVIQYFPASYGNDSMRKRTRRFPSTRPRSIPFVDARASRTGWFVAPSRMAKSTSRSSTGSFVRTSTWIVSGSCRRTSPSPEPFDLMICTSAISASRVPCSGTNPGSVTPSNTYRISRTTSSGAPIECTRPWWSIAARSQMSRTVSRACVTRTMVRPSRWNCLTRSMHLAWKASSPTVRTSSTSRTSGSTCTATAKPRRTSMPDE